MILDLMLNFSNFFEKKDFGKTFELGKIVIFGKNVNLNQICDFFC